MRRSLLFALLLVPAAELAAQSQALPQCSRDDRYCAEIAAVARHARVQRAFRYLEQTEAAAMRDLITITQTPAPPFREAERARKFAEMLRASGADTVYIDSVGNVIGVRRGLRRARVLAIAGHLDTVFPEGTDVKVKVQGDTLFAPGVGDNSRGLVVLLQMLRALKETGIRTNADLWFVGTVGEEGLGDLRGVKHLFKPGKPKIDAFIAVDGSSDEEITNVAVGSKRYRVTFQGEGGHSYGDFGAANPIHALGRAIHLFDEAAARFVVTQPGTTYNIGRINGGTSVNSIASSAWMEVDMRSDNGASLAAIDSVFHVSMVRALNEQNAKRIIGEELRLEARLVGDRPGGNTPPNAALVQRAIAATRALGLTPLLDRSSTDANLPISRGVPAITIGRGGISANAHSPDEYWIDVESNRGIRRLMLIALAEAGLPAR